VEFFEPWRWYNRWGLEASKAFRLWLYGFNPTLADSLIPRPLELPTAPYALDYRTEIIPPGWVPS